LCRYDSRAETWINNEVKQTLAEIQREETRLAMATVVGAVQVQCT
jgi:hypothetical protein